MTTTSVSGRSQSTALVPSSSASGGYAFEFVYVRKLTPDELREPDIIGLFQNCPTEITEVYGAFNHLGNRIGAGVERELVVEAAQECGFKPQGWLV